MTVGFSISFKGYGESAEIDGGSSWYFSFYLRGLSNLPFSNSELPLNTITADSICTVLASR